MPNNFGLLGKFLGPSTPQPTKVGQGVVRYSGGLPAPKNFEQAYANRKTLVSTDMMTANGGNVAGLLSTQFTELGAFTVPVQTCLRYGYGQVGQGYEWATGTLFWDFNNAIGTGADIDGLARYFASNSQGTFKSFFTENTTGRLRQTTPSERIRNPEQDPPIYENSRLVLEFKPNTTTTTQGTSPSATNSTAEVDVTLYL